MLELLQDKFHLFDGVFGASDPVLGQIESGLDFERRIAEIQARMQETERQLLAHFDADIHDLLRNHKERAE